MILRPARAGDAAAIAALWAPLIRDTTITFTTREKTAEEIAAQIAAQPEAALVAAPKAAPERLIGFARFGPFRAGPGYGHTAELSIVLAESARGQGTGRALLGALEQAARGRGIHVLVAAISAENSPGIGFHRALGFAEVGRMAQVGRKFDRWLDLVLMQKTL